MKKKLHKGNVIPKGNLQRNLILVLIAATLLIFGQTIAFEFVNFDDPNLIYNNVLITDNSIPLSECFNKFIFSPYYKPLTLISWKLEYMLFGVEPWHFHLINTIFHATSTVILYFIGLRIFKNYEKEGNSTAFAAFFLAFIFAIHPMHIESVAWATERKDVLFGFFYLSGLLSYLKGRESGKSYFFILSGLLYLCSGLSKSMGITLIAILPLLDYIHDGKLRTKHLTKYLPHIAAFLILLFLFGYFNFSKDAVAAGTIASDPTELTFQITSLSYIDNLPNFLEVIVTGSYKILLWILHLLFPFALSVFYPFDEIYGFFGYAIFLSPLILLGIFLVAFRKRKNSPIYLGGLVFFIISMAPVLFVSSSGQGIFLSDRYTYIPSIGLFALMIYGIINNITLKNRLKALGAFAGFFFVLALLNIGNWRNSELLYTQALKVYPKSRVAHLNLGSYYNSVNEKQKAIKTYTNGIKFWPTYYKLFTNRAKVHEDQGNRDLALTDLNKGLSLRSGHVPSLNLRGKIFGEMNKLDLALKDFNKALEINPQDMDALTNRGYLHLLQGNNQLTINDYSLYDSIKPNDPNIINTIGLAYKNLGQYDKAITYYTKSINLQPSQGAFYSNLAETYYLQGNIDLSRKNIMLAQQLGFAVSPTLVENLR